MTEIDFITALAEFTTRTPETLTLQDDLAERLAAPRPPRTMTVADDERRGAEGPLVDAMAAERQALGDYHRALADQRGPLYSKLDAAREAARVASRRWTKATQNTAVRIRMMVGAGALSRKKLA